MPSPQSPSDAVPPRRWWREWLVASVVLVATATYNQPYWPAPWLDEGFVTNGAMTLATRQVYGTSSADGVRVVHPTLVANGPGVLIPVAAAMRLSGTDIRTARGTAGLFMVLCGLLAVWLGIRLGFEPAGRTGGGRAVARHAARRLRLSRPHGDGQRPCAGLRVPRTGPVAAGARSGLETAGAGRRCPVGAGRGHQGAVVGGAAADTGARRRAPSIRAGATRYAVIRA